MNNLNNEFQKDYNELCEKYNNVEIKEPTVTTFDVCNAVIKQVEDAGFTPHHIKYIDENGNLVEITK